MHTSINYDNLTLSSTHVLLMTPLESVITKSTEESSEQNRTELDTELVTATARCVHEGGAACAHLK